MWDIDGWKMCPLLVVVNYAATFFKYSEPDFRELSALKTSSQTDNTSSSYHTRWAIKELFPALYGYPQGRIIPELPNKETVRVYSVKTKLLDPWNLIPVSEYGWNCTELIETFFCGRKENSLRRLWRVKYNIYNIHLPALYIVYGSARHNFGIQTNLDHLFWTHHLITAALRVIFSNRLVWVFELTPVNKSKIWWVSSCSKISHWDNNALVLF